MIRVPNFDLWPISIPYPFGISFGKRKTTPRWPYMIMMRAHGWRWTTTSRMSKNSARIITRVLQKVRSAPCIFCLLVSCVFFSYFSLVWTCLSWFGVIFFLHETSPKEDPLRGVWQQEPILSTRLLLRNPHLCESPRHSIYALGICNSARYGRLRVRHPSGVISRAHLRCTGGQPISCNPPMVQFGTLRSSRLKVCRGLK